MITFKQRGNFDSTEKFLRGAKSKNYFSILERHANEGLVALKGATPRDSGLTAESWGFKIVKVSTGYRIYWTNDHITTSGVPIAILIQYGHGTKNGGFVEARDYINPVMRPIFERISENIWKEVSSL